MKGAVVGVVSRSYMHSCKDSAVLYGHLMEVASLLGWSFQPDHPLSTPLTLVFDTSSAGHTHLLVNVAEAGVLHVTARKSGIYRYDWNGNLRQIRSLKVRLEEVSGYPMMPINRRSATNEGAAG
ncbi:hypothetical protein [Aestuariirhabdus litorea]|uniref:Uncharacterized protein n=1 Tax=Aestuariirhabdus litorea TaxID=2528527 RepID=A0A3P3VR96_9GAMM|nr:hypothetical protein [Aestuariirhabdus litorea]RRJ84827.1 hypothetical protein D0544_06970 [Aestuariirhabdus litorea]RWW98052.1 hypothetical protein DZC74_06965 [Endozoicomonadaceae bacterium GTF-13]